MAFTSRRHGWDIAESRTTPEPAYLNRREFLAVAGAGFIGTAGDVLSRSPADETRPLTPDPGIDPSPHRGCNYVELGMEPHLVRDRMSVMQPRPGVIQIGGMVRRKRLIDIEELTRRFGPEERVYRFRCVEGWSTIVPWLGFELRKLIDWCSPAASARYVSFVSACDTRQMRGVAEQPWYPWPYREALSMAEAVNPLAFVATGAYGRPLSGGRGGPVRIVVPWKYGYKSPKAVVRLEFVGHRPRTFWNTVNRYENPFNGNVDPAVPHPRWGQQWEVVVGTGDRVPTLPMNGYARWVPGATRDT